MARPVSQILLEDYSLTIRPGAEEESFPTVGDWCYLFCEKGIQQNAIPYLIKTIEQGPDGHSYARFAETTTGWPLAHCQKTEPLSPAEAFDALEEEMPDEYRHVDASTLDACTTPFSLSVLTVTKGKGHASKSIIAGANGHPIKGHDSLAISGGMLEHVEVQGLQGVRDLLLTIQPNQALVHGIVKGSQPGVVRPVVTTERLKQARPGTLAPETIARSLEYIAYPDGVFVLMFDRDNDPEDPTTVPTTEALLTLLDGIIPGLASAGAVLMSSTSSAIRCKTTQAWLIPPTSSHTYFLARGNLPRFKELLTVRLWNAGYGFCKLGTPNAQTGVAAVLTRAVVDLSVFSPERLDYVAGARIDKHAPFYQDRGSPQLRPGALLDLDAFPDITSDERQAYTDRLTAAKAALAPKRFACVQAVVQAQAPDWTEAEVHVEVEQRLAHIESAQLPPDYLLYFDHRKTTVAVQDLSAAYDGLRLADPAEPTYREGTDAIFHWHKGDWLINSFAHGLLTTYRAVPTPPPEPEDGDMQDLIQRVEAGVPGGGDGQEDSRPKIFIGPEISDVTDEAEAALLRLPGVPRVYQRAGGLCVIAYGADPPKWLHRPEDVPIAIDPSPAHLRELVGQAATWWKLDKRTKNYEQVLPPAWVVETLQGRTSQLFPVLEGVICSPTLRPDGSVLATPGYDPETGLYLDFNGTTFPPLSNHPTLDNARTALGRLQEPLIDFPFAEPWHFSTTLAAMLSLVCRFAIMGNVPLFAIRANARGSGKGLLADVVSIIGTGRAAPRWPQVTEDEEERKRLLTVALAGYPCIHIDNVTKPLGSPALDLALTAPSFSDRILGKNASREAPLSMIWLASGNNMQFQGDTARRVVPIDLDSKMEKPEERTDFQHTPLLPWVRCERPQCTVAALTIIQAFFEAGCPSQGLTPMGSFEEWSDLVRQALVWAGEADPNEGRKAIEAESDPEYERLATLLAAWAACYPIPQGMTRSPAKTLNDVIADIAALKAMDKPPATPGKPNTPNEYDTLQDALGAFDPKYDGKELRGGPIGNRLRTIKGRMIGTQRLNIIGTERTNKSLWGIEAFS